MYQKTTLGMLAAVLLSGTAWAQQSPTAPTAPSADKPAATAAAGPQFVAMQQSGERLGSELKGSVVKNSANETLGSVSDILVSDDNKVVALIIGVGGFLGIGATDVAVKMESAKFVKDKDGTNVVQINATRDDLTKAPKFVSVKGRDDQMRREQSSPGTSRPGSAKP